MASQSGRSPTLTRGVARVVGSETWSLDRVAQLRERVHRDRTQSHYVEGVRFIVTAADADARFRTLVVAPKLLRSPLGQMLARRLRSVGVPTLTISSEVFARLSQSKEPQGIGAVLAQEWTELDSVRAGPADCWLCVSEIQSPGNLGTLIRTASAAGARGVICLRGGTADPYHPTTTRAAMGAMHSLQFVQTDAAGLRSWQRRERALIVGALPRAEADYRSLSYQRPVVLFIGGERKGLLPAQQALCDAEVRIPMQGGDSLNLAVAGSLMLYEVWRQRHPVLTM